MPLILPAEATRFGSDERGLAIMWLALSCVMCAALCWTDRGVIIDAGNVEEPAYAIVIPGHILPRCVPAMTQPDARPHSSMRLARLIARRQSQACMNGRCAHHHLPADCPPRSNVQKVDEWCWRDGINALLSSATLLALGMLTPPFSTAFFASWQDSLAFRLVSMPCRPAACRMGSPPPVGFWVCCRKPTCLA